MLNPSEIHEGKFVQTIYLEDDASATTSSTKEETFLTFAEAEKELTLSIMGEVDTSGYAALNNQTQKEIVISQRDDVTGTDTALASIVIVKLQ